MPFASVPDELSTEITTRNTGKPSAETRSVVSTEDTVPDTSLIAEGMDTVALWPDWMEPLYVVLNSSVSFIMLSSIIYPTISPCPSCWPTCRLPPSAGIILPENGAVIFCRFRRACAVDSVLWALVSVLCAADSALCALESSLCASASSSRVSVGSMRIRSSPACTSSPGSTSTSVTVPRISSPSSSRTRAAVTPLPSKKVSIVP